MEHENTNTSDRSGNLRRKLWVFGGVAAGLIAVVFIAKHAATKNEEILEISSEDVETAIES